MAHSLFSSSNAFSILFFLSLPSLLTSEFIPNTLSLSVSWSHQTHTHLYPNAICRVSPRFLFTLFPLLNAHYVYNSSYHSVLLSLSLSSPPLLISLSHTILLNPFSHLKSRVALKLLVIRKLGGSLK